MGFPTHFLRTKDMNTNTNKLKTTLTALSLITASVFTVSAAHAATQNEVQVTAVDFEGLDDNLYGARYVRYLDVQRFNEKKKNRNNKITNRKQREESTRANKINTLATTKKEP